MIDHIGYIPIDSYIKAHADIAPHGISHFNGYYVKSIILAINGKTKTPKGKNEEIYPDSYGE